MIQPQAMKYGGLEIMNMNRFFGDVVTNFVGGTIDNSFFDPPPRELSRVGIDVITTPRHIA